MWKKLLILYGVFAVSLAVLIMLSLYSFQRYNAYVNYANAVNHHYYLLTQLHTLKNQLFEVENLQHKLLLFGDSTYLREDERNITAIKNTFAAIHSLTLNDEDQQKHLYKLNMAMKAQLDFLQTSVTLRDAPGLDAEGKKGMRRCMDLIDDMAQAEQGTLASRTAIKEFYETRTPQYFRGVFIFTMLAFCISFGLLAGQYRSRIRYQQNLEQKIIALNQANAEWEQISYVASHDLQEPLRKIRTFADRLNTRFSHLLDEEAKTILSRIDAGSMRAQSLMQDIVNYNSIAYTREAAEPVDLRRQLHTLLDNDEEKLLPDDAVIKIENLPVVEGYPSQINLLFKCLISNSVKFSKPGTPCTISITATTIAKEKLPVKDRISYEEYYKIDVTDNGIGFDNTFAEKIFQMFQRLHAQDSPYEGRGLGLAIVKRIMTNHLGLVEADGDPGKGATFTLYFPVR